MYICYDKRFIFFHVPRVAGTALLHKLRKTHDIDMQIGEHESMEHLYDNFGKSSDLWADYFKICFVRNPWDRLVSAFHYLALGGINFTDNRVSNLYIQHYDGDFNEFVKNHDTWFNAKAHFIPYSYKSSPHLLPQVEFVCYKGHLLPDFIGRYETLTDDLGLIASTLKLRLRTSALEVKNESERKKDYREYYDSDSVDIVSKLYAEDIETFKYTFD